MKHKRYLQREHFNKKGVSPLIASVLLIGFAIILSIIVITYSNQQTLSLQRSTEKIISSSVPINFEIKQATSIDLQKIRLLVQSNSQTSINSFIIRLYGDKGTQSANINGVNPLETSFIETTYNYNLVGNINKIELIPKTIEGQQTFTHDVSLSTTIDVKQEIASKCNQDLDNNGIPDCISQEIISPTTCIINNVSWSDSSVLNSSYVDLIIESNNCNNIEFPITYEEVDTLTPNDIVPEINLPQNITLKNNKAKLKWKANWFDDQDGNDNSPDLIFTIDGISSNILEIKKINAPYSGLCPEVKPLDKRERQNVLEIGENFEKVKLNNNKEKVILHPNTLNIKDEFGKYKQFVDIANVTYKDCKLDIDFENNKLTLVPQLTYNNTIYTPENINLLDENILFDVSIDKTDLYKYSISITNIPDDIKSGIQNIKLKLQTNLDLGKATFDNENIYLPNNIQLGFTDLIVSGYAININSPQEIIIENITNLNNIYLDPTISLTTTNINYDITADKFTDYIAPYCTASISYSCDSPTASLLRVGYEPGIDCIGDPFTFTPFNDRRAFQEYKTSSIPINAKIENVDFKHSLFNLADYASSSFSFMKMGATNPLSSYSCTSSSGLWSKITSSTQYATATGFNSGSLKIVNLGTQANQDLQNDLQYERFILGVKRTGSTQDKYTYGAGGHNLEVTYSVDIPKWNNPRTNATVICPGDLVEFRTDWTEDVDLKNYTFTIDLDADDNFKNSSTITTGTGWAGLGDTFGTSLNITRVAATYGSNVSWQFIACDSKECNNTGDGIGMDSFKVATPEECDPCHVPTDTDLVIPQGREVTCQYTNIDIMGITGGKNLTVNGKLTLDHVNLTLDTNIGDFKTEIKVNDTGELIINNSNISALKTQPPINFYIFNVRPKANFTLENSIVTDYGGGVDTSLPVTKGLFISTNNTIIRGNLLYPGLRQSISSYGIYYNKSSNNILENNTIVAEWMIDNSRHVNGVFFTESYNNTINNNEINTTQYLAEGDALVILQPTFNKNSILGFNISNNRITTNAKNIFFGVGNGLVITGSGMLHYNFIYNNTVAIKNVAGGSAMQIVLSANNTLIDNKITIDKVNSNGLYLGSGSDGNTLINSNITTYDTNSYAINDNAKNLTAINSKIDSRQSQEINFNSASILFINTTFDKDKVTLAYGSFFHVKWFLYVTILDSFLLPAENVNVIINDTYNNIAFNGYTDSNGRIITINLSEYKITGLLAGGMEKTPYTNYTIKAVKGNSRAQQVTNLTNSTFITITLPPDKCNPSGDWLIQGSEEVYCENTIINLNGNLTVRGNLTLNNITLILDDAPKKRFIFVDNSSLAKLIINASKINTTTSTNYYGFLANSRSGVPFANSNLSITYSNITDYGNPSQSSERGFLIRSAFAVIKNNFFEPKETFAYGLNLANGSRMLIENNTINSKNFFGTGIWLEKNNHNTIKENRIYTKGTNGAGIQVTLESFSNDILNNNITTSGSGNFPNAIILEGPYNFIKNNELITQGSSSFSGWASAVIVKSNSGDQNKIIDSRIKSDNDYDISIFANTTTYFINSTFDKTNETGTIITHENGTIITQWYLDVYVNDSLAPIDTPIEGATVKGINRTFEKVFEDITDLSGKIPRKTLTEFVRNMTFEYQPSNYSIGASKNNLVAGKEINMTDNKFVVLGLHPSTIPDVDKVFITNDGTLKDCTSFSCSIIPLSHNNVTNLNVIVSTTDLDQSCDLATQNGTVYFCLNAPGVCIEPTADFKLKLDKVVSSGNNCNFTFNTLKGPAGTMQFYIAPGLYSYTVNITELEIQKNPDSERDGAWEYMPLISTGLIDDNKQLTTILQLGTNPNTLNQFNPGTTRYRIENWGNAILNLDWSSTNPTCTTPGTCFTDSWNLPSTENLGNTLQLDDDNQQSDLFPGDNLTNINLINNPRLFIYTEGLKRCIRYSCESQEGREVLPLHFHIIPPLGLRAGIYESQITYTATIKP